LSVSVPAQLAAPRGVPSPVVAAIAVAWVAAVAAEVSGVAGSVHHDSLLESGPAFGPALLLFLLAWQVMTAAMMLPSSLPLVRMYMAASAHAPGRRAALVAFLGGYALVWSAFGAMAFLGDAGLHAAVDASPWLTKHDWAIAPAVLLLAGAFQFSSLKEACLRSCRHPASFLRRHYRRGARGGFMLGAHHGAFCVGCCWALMATLFALGVMSIGWMAAIAGVIALEKLLPWERIANRGVSVLLAVLALVVALG
jgi:predicted metal-binding membrane protein